ncbi:MAG: TraR/DksA family transcriptional regulator [Isosphaeraceae bacterium]
MTRKEALLKLTAQLISRRDSLRKTLSGDLDTFRNVTETNVVGDDVDAAVDTATDEIFSQLVEIESKELTQIEHALERIASGAWGRCEFCGGKIPEARLHALPYTTSCIDCQRAIERQGHFRVMHPHSKQWAKVQAEPFDDDEALARTKLGELEFGFSERRHRHSSTVLV